MRLLETITGTAVMLTAAIAITAVILAFAPRCTHGEAGIYAGNVLLAGCPDHSPTARNRPGLPQPAPLPLATAATSNMSGSKESSRY